MGAAHGQGTHAGPEAAWLRPLEARPDATSRLILLPHAGGSAGFFRDWPKALPPDIEAWAVQYPGRERRIKEPPARSLDELARGAADAIAPLLDRPTAVLGHSMGATIGYEVLRLLLADPGHARALVHFFASARQAPHHPRDRQVHLLPEEEFLEVLRRHGGVNAEVLAEPDLRDLFLPIVRADYRLAETHVPTPVSPPLPLDLTVLTGTADLAVEPAAAARWADVTAGSFHHEVLPGDHFFPAAQLPAVASVVTRRLRVSAARPG
ncbi:thioesterase II family protein [Streptomyces uncialis]|uniref:thioesterase II family protein n=1 Tax=Streptomyces uncialis TaxID=1048205 RepID=UPI0037A70E57